MEIDARIIREVEFREKIRGYNPDDVDDFLEQVALAFEAMEDRLRSASAAPAATGVMPQVETRDIRSSSPITPMERAKENGAGYEFDDDTIQRTLLLAQKTADMTVKKAEEQAETTLEEAKARAEVLVTQAQQRAREIVDDAVNQARDEVLDLAKSKDRLLAELSQLTSRVSSAKGQMKHLLESVLMQIEESFAPFANQENVPAPRAHDADRSEDAGIVESSSTEKLFSDDKHFNGTGVFDDELE